jgi:recombining binding protein (suppressor of hairless)
MARAATWHPLSSDSGPDFNMAPADPARPPRPEISRWELGEILKTSTVPRDRLMSVDSASSPLSHQNHGTFLPSHYDQSLDHHPPHSANHLSVHPFDNDKMDGTEHPSYDMFPHPPPPPQPQQQPSFPHQRFRSNTSPAAPSYGPNSEPIYSGIFSHDSVPSFHSQSAGPYEMMGSISSSLSSGKATPLTPSDPGGLPFSAGPTNGIKQDFSDLMSDRRFPSEMHDDFSLAVNSQPNFGSTTLPPFSDRMPRFPSDGFLGQPQLQGHPSEPLRSVPPQATHTRFDGATSYDEISNYLIPSPQNDMGLRIPGVEDTMIRMRMGQMGASADLHTFIR